MPAIVRYEVGRYTLAHGGDDARGLALRALSRFEGCPIDEVLADSAALLAHQHKLSMADALVVGAALSCQAELGTQDQHFEGMPSVRFFRK